MSKSPITPSQKRNKTKRNRPRSIPRPRPRPRSRGKNRGRRSSRKPIITPSPPPRKSPIITPSPSKAFDRGPTMDQFMKAWSKSKKKVYKRKPKNQSSPIARQLTYKKKYSHKLH